MRRLMILFGLLWGCASAGDSGVDAAIHPADGAADAPAAQDAAVAETRYDASVPDGASGDGAASDSAPGDGPPADAASSDAPVSVIRLSEIYVDRDLSGDSVEFVELLGPIGASLDNLRLRIITHTGVVSYDLAAAPPGSVIGASGFWVVGGNNVSTIASTWRVDLRYTIDSWGLDNGAGAVQLLRGAGPTAEVLDVLGWGATVPAPGVAPTATAEGSPASLPAYRGQSFGRRNGVDTGNNAADFCTMTTTPGSTNGACL